MRLMCLVLLMPAIAYGELFSITEVSTGEGVSQSVQSGYLDRNQQATLVVNMVDAGNKRLLKLYDLKSDQLQQRPSVERKIGSQIIFSDVAKGLDTDQLIFFSRNKAERYDLRRDEMMPVMTFTSIYNSPVYRALPELDVFQDLNDDGLDDLLLPDYDGFWVFIQGPEGNFSEGIKLGKGPLTEMSYNNYPWYQEKQVYRTDVNFDGRKDLIFWHEGGLEAHYQLDKGLFSGVPTIIVPDVAFEHEGMDGITMRLGEDDHSNKQSRSLYQVTDLNGDGIGDLVSLSIDSQGVFKKTTRYEIHLGYQDDTGGIRFALEPDTQIESDGIQFEMDERDFDQDGAMDVVVSSVDIGIGKIVSALLTGSVDLDLNFYRMKSSKYPDKPNIRREITAEFSLSTGDVFFPSVLITDVTGDQLDDLLVQDGRDLLRVYPGEATENLFSRKAIEIKTEMPTNPDMVKLTDFNRDGRKDILMQFDSKTESNRVKLLITTD